MSGQRILRRRGLIKLGSLFSVTIKLFASLQRPRFVADLKADDYQFELLPAEARRNVEPLFEMMLGLEPFSLSDAQRYKIAVGLDRTLQTLPEAMLEEVQLLFKMLDLPIFRWYVGLFGDSWYSCAPKTLDEACLRFRNTRLRSVQAAFLNLQNLISSSFYSQSFEWHQLTYPNHLIFGDESYSL